VSTPDEEPYEAGLAPFVCTLRIAHGNPPATACAPTLPASTASRPTFVTMANALFWDGTNRYIADLGSSSSTISENQKSVKCHGADCNLDEAAARPDDVIRHSSHSPHDHAIRQKDTPSNQASAKSFEPERSLASAVVNSSARTQV